MSEVMSQINDHDSEIRRKQLAQERGLPEDATYAQINDHDRTK